MNKLKFVRYIFIHKNPFELSECKLDLVVNKNMDVSTLEFSVKHEFLENKAFFVESELDLNKNNANSLANNLYSFNDSINLKVKDGIMNQYNYIFADRIGTCIKNTLENTLHRNSILRIGQNQIFSCFYNLNKEEFISLCENNDLYIQSKT